ncbi:hypothetical protein TpMuguga_01g01018 [Theileria parva strain Muguga]|uniref:Uncharacterized protein n=1 Tax=Theileria parva TaxID=5875 RepID=Q4N702_THEPA|nr:uncharacterized protein TpMuguga_01g01018 [Theileria parva strain Muguga]EAN34256.1 hypothetical protein TpMuguga_01g01018 [Theileria parva strain Muguga]|eukprot:XP_766539.1 hypothetical protein [Theileria parva strain Muguga]
MDSEVFFESRPKKRTLDSPTDDTLNSPVVKQPNTNTVSNTNTTSNNLLGNTSYSSNTGLNGFETIRVSSIEQEEYYNVDHSTDKSSLTRQFLNSFLVDFTEDELAAKRTVETIYNASRSFSYTYRSLHEAFFTKSTQLTTLLPFVKAISSVADTAILLSTMNSKNSSTNTNTTNTSNNKSSTNANNVNGKVDPVSSGVLMNYELIMLGIFRKFYLKLHEFESLEGNRTWEKVLELMEALLKDGVFKELRGLFSQVYNIEQMNYGDFKRYLTDFRLYLTHLQDELYPKSGNKRKLASVSESFSLQNCIDFINFINRELDNLRKLLLNVVKHVMNTPVTDSLTSILNKLSNNFNDPDKANSASGGSGGQVEDEKCILKCVNMLLEEESLFYVVDGQIEHNVNMCLEKYNNMYKAYEEEVRRRSDAVSEFEKKRKFKRDSVQYVLDRLAEVNSPTLANNFKNPFYTVGLSPKLCTKESFRKYAKKLKMLLHPDTEHDADWKQKAEKAFKEASLALDQCVKLLETFSASLYRVGPAPPYLSHLNIVLPPNSTFYTSTSSNTTTNESTPSDEDTKAKEVQLVYFPEFSLRCDDQKVGSLSVEVDLTSLVDRKIWQSMGKNRQIIMYVLRPLHYEPYTIQLPSEMISSTQKLKLTDNPINKTPILKVEAVQPIRFGTSWKYFVGVKISGEMGSTLVSYKSLFIELPSKGRTINHITKLLKTFTNASFIDQNSLQLRLNAVKETNSKAEAEKFLIECTKLAQKWADEN